MPLTERSRAVASPILGTGPAARLLLPMVAFLVAFLLVPLAGMLELSFLTHSAQDLWVKVLTFGNYRRVFDEYYFDIFARSVRIAGISTFVCVCLGYPVAYFLSRCSARTLSIGLLLLATPLMVSTVIRAFGWQVILGSNGIIDQVLLAFRLGHLGVMYTETAVIIALIQLVLPLMVLPVMASIDNIPIEIEEAAANLGAGRWGIFSKVIFPLSLPGLASGSTLAFAVAISVVVTPALLGGRRSRMVGNEIYDQVLTGLNWPFASAMSIVLIVAILLLMGVPSLVGRFRG